MGDLEDLLKKGIGLLSGETIIAEALKALVVDELKEQLKARIMADPARREALKEAAKEYLEAKTREQLAVLKAAKVVLEAAISLVPEELADEVSAELASLLEGYMKKMAEKLG